MKITVAQDLTKLFNGPEQWTKGRSARSASGYGVWPDSEDACAWCLTGKLNSLGLWFNCSPEREAISSAALELFPERYKSTPKLSAMAAFNDHADTTFDDVQAVLKRAQEKLEGKP